MERQRVSEAQLTERWNGEWNAEELIDTD